VERPFFKLVGTRHGPLTPTGRPCPTTTAATIGQDEIGRGLSLLLVGGTQYVRDVAGRFASFTLIDSQPFKQSVSSGRKGRGARELIGHRARVPLPRLLAMYSHDPHTARRWRSSLVRRR
jgi:hypothetical protein